MAAPEEKIEKIAKIEKLGNHSPIDKVAEEPLRQAPDKERFDTLVSNQGSARDKTVGKTVELDKGSPRGSLLDEVRSLNEQVNKVAKVSSKDLVAQAEHLINDIEKIKSKLASPHLAVHPSTQGILQNKLSHIDENLRTVLAKSGLEYRPSADLNNKTINPIERFLGFLSHGQVQLTSMMSEVNTMALNNKEISVANMLRIQMKMGYITQELQFFSAVLNKALDSTKTIMNIQV